MGVCFPFFRCFIVFDICKCSLLLSIACFAVYEQCYLYLVLLALTTADDDDVVELKH